MGTWCKIGTGSDMGKVSFWLLCVVGLLFTKLLLFLIHFLIVTIFGTTTATATTATTYRPPGAPPLAYHRDSPYFMFEPNDVATVWIALDDMHPELGPLTYVKSSHRWGDGRIGSSQNFFQDNGGKSLLYSAAKREGIDNVEESLEFESMAGMQAGGMSIHGEFVRQCVLYCTIALVLVLVCSHD
mmetsp:Transcript_7665/g.14475  ORF Transcript_7665/g.14475 Transcript_7665/m.14475 type:complete len:185 (+) Transcript_7665:709-1263(+)